MARALVHLYIEQEAEVEVDAPLGADEATLRRLALAELDLSGGDQWRTTFGYTQVTWPGQRPTRADVTGRGTPQGT